MHARALGALAGACLVALPAAANADFPHVVSRGETLTSVAAQDGLTVAALAAANGLSPTASLTAGTVLQIPPQGVTETQSTGFQGAGQTGSVESGGGSYVVRLGDTLSGIAAHAGTTVDQLAAANGISRRNLVVAGTTLTLPGGSSGSAGGTTEFVSTTTGGGGGSYVVRPGDTLSGIAAQAGTTVEELAATNGISRRNFLLAGTTLTLPGGSSGSAGGTTEPMSTSTGGGGGGRYVVRPGDTLSGIAAQAGTTVDELASMNGISRRNFLLAGTTLTLPGGSSQAGGGTAEFVSTTTGEGENGGGSYVVKPGDTLSGIAAQAGTTVDQLAVMNGISRRNLVLAGTTLTLPGGSSQTGSATQAVSTNSGSSSAANVPTTTGSGGPPYPTNQYASASEIASLANAEGVPPALAEAIAWQESGFNNSEVSDVGAVGVMQIVPDTWTWISDHLATIPLQPASASDNVRAGVLLLHALLDQTGGSDSESAAGYYQGLASIRRNGLYPSTRRYVASVMSLMARFGG